MNYYLITLRILHIGLGIMWAGAILTFAFFIIPTLNSMGNEAGKFMMQLNKVARYPMYIAIIATLTIITGFLLLWKISAGFNSIWMLSHYGRAMSAGGGLATLAYIMGMTIVRPTTMKLSKLAQEIASGNMPPSPEQLSSMDGYRKKIGLFTWIITLLLVLCVICMSIAQYI